MVRPDHLASVIRDPHVLGLACFCFAASAMPRDDLLGPRGWFFCLICVDGAMLRSAWREPETKVAAVSKKDRNCEFIDLAIAICLCEGAAVARVREACGAMLCIWLRAENSQFKEPAAEEGGGGGWGWKTTTATKFEIVPASMSIAPREKHAVRGNPSLR